jgi:hemerythrin-like domain-containing protein
MSAPPTVDTRDMLVVHDAIRREYGLSPAEVSAVAPGGTVRAGVLAAHLDLLNNLLHHHHAGEDRLLWPVLQPRVPAHVASSVEQIERQHDGIAKALETVGAALARWRTAAAAPDRDALADTLQDLLGRITEHLAAEEEHILPLAAAHLSPAEWNRLGAEGLGSLPKSQLPLVLGMLMYRADPDVIAGMLAHAPLVPRLVMPHLAPRVYARYARKVHLTATP